MKRIMAVIITLVMMVFVSACASESATDYGSTITTVTFDDVTAYVYYPTPNAADSSAVKLATTAPFYLVFGDGPMTPEECVTYANQTGLAQLAAEKGGTISFVQPKGENWDYDADADAYGEMVTHMDYNAAHKYENGISNEMEVFSGTTQQRIMGDSETIFVYGIGSGADLIANNWMKPLTFPGTLSPQADYTITGVTLENLTDVSNISDNDIPTVSINNSQEVNEALEVANTNDLFMTADNNDYLSQADELANAYRRQDEVLIPATDYEALGITQSVETFDAPTAADNPLVTGEVNPINYITYYSDDLDVDPEGEKVPLVLTFHGIGNNAVYQALASEWPQIAKENGFIAVSVDDHLSHTATEIVSLVNHLEEEYPIDTTRIYASGFSMGAVKTWDLLQQYADIFAGFAPMHAGFGPHMDSNQQIVPTINEELVAPVFYVAGELSPLPEFPFGEGMMGGPNPFAQMVAYTFEINGVPVEYQYNESANPWWGISGDLTYQVTDKNIFTDSVLNVNLFKSSDGNYYTAYSNASNESHEIYGRNSWVAWDFLKQFKRLPDGTIEISKVEYELPSDDGKITDNSYAAGVTIGAEEK